MLALAATCLYHEVSRPCAASTVSLCSAGFPHRSLEQNMSGKKALEISKSTRSHWGSGWETYGEDKSCAPPV